MWMVWNECACTFGCDDWFIFCLDCVSIRPVPGYPHTPCYALRGYHHNMATKKGKKKNDIESINAQTIITSANCERISFIAYQTRFDAYILGFPATAKCGFLGDVFDIYKIGDFCIFQANGFIYTCNFGAFTSFWTERQIGHVSETSNHSRWWYQAYPIPN